MNSSNQLLKTFALTLILFVSLNGFSQKSINELLQKAEWEEIEHSKNYSDELRLEFQKDKKAIHKMLNGNNSFFTFGKDGSFEFNSIQDYTASNVNGTYELNSKFTKIIVTVTKEHKLNEIDKVGDKIIYKILSLEDGILVLKKSGRVYYLILND